MHFTAGENDTFSLVKRPENNPEDSGLDQVLAWISGTALLINNNSKSDLHRDTWF